MALEYDVVRYTADTSKTAGQTFDVTSPNITDFSCCLVFAYGFAGGTLGTEQAHARVSVGAADALGVGACCSRSAPHNNTAQAQGVTRRAGAGAGHVCAIVGDPASTADGGQLWAFAPVSKVSSGITNGIRFTTVVQATAAFEIVVVFFGGLVGADVVTLSDTSFPGSPLAYTPDVLFASVDSSGTNSTGSTANDYQPSFGVAVNKGGLPQVCLAGEWNRGDPTDSDETAISNRVAAEVQGGAVSVDLEVTTWSTQITVGTPTGASIGGWGLLAKFPAGCAFGVALETLPGSAVATVFSGMGIRPDLVVGAANLITTTDAVVDGATAAADAVFAHTLAAEFCGASRQKEGDTITPGGTHTSAGTVFDDVALVISEHAGTKVVEAARSAMGAGDGDGFKLSFSLAQAGRMVVFGLAPPQTLSPSPVALGVSPAAPVLNLVHPASPVTLGVQAPSVARLLSLVPGSVPLGISAPAPTRLPVLIPAAVALGVDAPPPELALDILPPPPPRVRGPLAELYLRSLWDLLPRGFAWNRRPETVLGRLLRAWASELELVEFRAEDVREEADTRTTVELLAEWEALLGTLEGCPSFDNTQLERRYAVFRAYTMPGGQNAYHYSQVAKALGYQIEVEDFHEFDEFTCVSECDDYLTQGEWVFVVEIHAPVETPRFFRAGVSVAGEPLVTFGNDALTCTLDELKPAHVLFLYVFDLPYVGYSPWSFLAPSPAPILLRAPNPLRS